MCGRFTQTASGEAIAQAFNLTKPPELSPRYNIAPTQAVGAIAQHSKGTAQPEGDRNYRFFQWGLIPSWAKDPTIGARMFNARAETIAEKPSFRAPFKRRRCLIVADGFYEWQHSGESAGAKKTKKQPFYIHLKDHHPFGFAGLWDVWEGGDGSYMETCTIITTEPNEKMATLHDRMPVILHAEDYDCWLDPEVQSRDLLQPLLRPYEAANMTLYPVSTAMNTARHEDPDCIEPLAEAL
jgi:putative SOS response-associated peptidase YedK